MTPWIFYTLEEFTLWRYCNRSKQKPSFSPLFVSDALSSQHAQYYDNALLVTGARRLPAG